MLNKYVSCPTFQLKIQTYAKVSGYEYSKFFKSSYCIILPNNVGKKVLNTYIPQGMVDGSASKPALRQDTGYMVEKTYLDIAPYLGAFGAYLMPQ